VRDLIEHAETAEASNSLDRIQRAVEEAVIGAVLRNQFAAPFAEVRVRAAMRYDLLAIEVSDGVVDGEVVGPFGRVRDDGWSLDLVRAEMDVVAFTPTDTGGILRLERRLAPR
jgi:hypothetical protein